LSVLGAESPWNCYEDEHLNSGSQMKTATIWWPDIPIRLVMEKFSILIGRMAWESRNTGRETVPMSLSSTNATRTQTDHGPLLQETSGHWDVPLAWICNSSYSAILFYVITE
jgi:hypothetical protein